VEGGILLKMPCLMPALPLPTAPPPRLHAPLPPPRRMQDVPYFCNSHLIARLEVNSSGGPPGCVAGRAGQLPRRRAVCAAGELELPAHPVPPSGIAAHSPPPHPHPWPLRAVYRPVGSPAPASFNPNGTTQPKFAIREVFNESSYAAALELAKARQPHRTMKFGRRNGGWAGGPPAPEGVVRRATRKGPP
jgi:hypothetical protein